MDTPVERNDLGYSRAPTSLVSDPRGSQPLRNRPEIGANGIHVMNSALMCPEPMRKSKNVERGIQTLQILVFWSHW